MACNKLGYTFATMKIQKVRRAHAAPKNNYFLGTDRLLQFEAREDGIASNRKSAKLR